MLSELAVQALRRDSELAQERRHNAFLLPDQRIEQVLRLQLGMLQRLGEILGALDRLLRLNREFVKTDHRCCTSNTCGRASPPNAA